MKNHLVKTFLLTLTVVAALLGMFFLPRFSFGDTELRRVNILSDVQRRTTDGRIAAEVRADSAQGVKTEVLDSAAIKVEKPRYIDKTPKGMVAIEDFADSTGEHREMDKFYAALNETGSRPVRIAYYGDSYIEGDILTQDLRYLLQSKYGGKGAGFVDIMSLTSGFRQTVTQSSKGWKDHSANDKNGFKAELQGINCRYFIPSQGATLEVKGQGRIFPGKLDTMEVATIYFTPSAGLNLSASVNGEEETEVYAGGGRMEQALDDSAATEEIDDIYAETGQGIEAKSMNGHIGRFSMTVNGGSGSRFYGVALEGRRGIVLDNFSMRGSNGWQLASIPQPTMRRFAQLRPYDLIVLQYGLNIASPKTKDYSYYTKRLVKAIRNLKANYPGASILIVGVSDRGQRDAQGEMRTMSGVTELLSYQRRMAADEGVAFWNLYEAMGGEGSIAAMKEKKQANLDYTHINFDGGKHLADIFFKVLMNGKENYDRRMAR